MHPVKDQGAGVESNRTVSCEEKAPLVRVQRSSQTEERRQWRVSGEGRARQREDQVQRFHLGSEWLQSGPKWQRMGS